MFVYLDETGDTGFKFDKGSSRYFVVTILLVQDPIPLYTAHESHRDNLLQAVDMVSGAINASYTKDDFRYRRIIRSKLDEVWEL